jgi:Zn-dependent membrane protease YugP
MDDMIQQGRDPEWRLAFEDHLDDAARARLRRAVKNGQSVDHPGQAAIAVGLARREQRRIQFLRLVLLPVQLMIAVIWVRLFLVGRLPAAYGWFWVAVLLVLMGVVPFTLRRRHQVAGRAVEANEQIARNPG